MTELSSAPAAPPSDPLLTAPIFGTLLRLSLPNAVAMCAAALVAIAETGYVGQIGISALAGLALAFPMVMLQQMMSAGAMGGGVSSSISRALGADNPQRATRLAIHALVIGGLVGIVFSALFLLLGKHIYSLLGGSGVVLEEALAYSNVAFTGAVGIWLTNTLASIIRGCGEMKIPSLTLLVIAVAQFL